MNKEQESLKEQIRVELLNSCTQWLYRSVPKEDLIECIEYILTCLKGGEECSHQ
jgi:hypothetical protein